MLLETLLGIAEGSRVDNLDRMFLFLSPLLAESVKLLGTDSLSSVPVREHGKGSAADIAINKQMLSVVFSYKSYYRVSNLM